MQNTHDLLVGTLSIGIPNLSLCFSVLGVFFKNRLREYVPAITASIIVERISFKSLHIISIMYIINVEDFVLVVSEIYKEALKVQILNEVALIQVVRKRVSFQDRKNENTPKFPSIKI